MWLSFGPSWLSTRSVWLLTESQADNLIVCLQTFVTLGGGDPVDSGGPSPQDSLDVSGYILGTETASPRSVIVHDHFLTGATPPNSATGAIRIGDWKLLVGKQSFATWFGEFSPNATFNQSAAGVTACDDKPCLFNIAQGVFMAMVV